MKLYTIGYGGSSAEKFFSRLKRAGVKRLIDIRRHNTSQIAGFTKKNDLAWFARELAGADYLHKLELAPDEDLLKAYRGKKIAWEEFEKRFARLIGERHIEELGRETFSDACLVCSEPRAEHCHRHVIADYLKSRWPDVEIVHL